MDSLEGKTVGFCCGWGEAVTWIHRVEVIRGRNYYSNILPTRVSVHLHFKRYGSSTLELSEFLWCFRLASGLLGFNESPLRVKEDTVNNYTNAADIKHTNLGKSGFIQLLLASINFHCHCLLSSFCSNNLMPLFIPLLSSVILVRAVVCASFQSTSFQETASILSLLMEKVGVGDMCDYSQNSRF